MSNPYKSAKKSKSSKSGHSPVPFKTSPAIRSDVNQARRAANVSRGVRSSGDSKTYTAEELRAEMQAEGQKYLDATLENKRQVELAKQQQQQKAAITARQLAQLPTVEQPGQVYVPTPAGGLDKATASLSQKSQALEMQASRSRAKGKLGIHYSVGAFVVGAAAGATGLVTGIVHPVRTVKGIAAGAVRFARDPRGTGKRVGEQIYTRPAETTGKVAGTIGAAKVISWGATKVVQAVRKTQPVEVKSYTEGKALIKTKKVGQDTAKSTIEHSVKGRIKVGGKEYAVKSVERGGAVETVKGVGSQAGKVKHKIAEMVVNKKTGKVTAKPQVKAASSYRMQTQTAKGGDVIKVGAEVRTATKLPAGRYARSQDIVSMKGAKVLHVEKPGSVTTAIKKGTKTVKPTPTEVYQYKIGAANVKTQKVGSVSKYVKPLKKNIDISPEAAAKAVGKGKLKTLTVAISKKVKGQTTIRDTIYPAAPQGVVLKTRQLVKYVEKWHSKAITRKTTTPGVKAKAAAAGATVKKTLVKLHKSKKAAPTEVTFTQLIKKPGVQVGIDSLKIKPIALEAMKAAARLRYIYRPVPFEFETAAAAAALISFGQASYKSRYDVPTVRPAGPQTVPVQYVMPEVKKDTLPDVTPYVGPAPAPPQQITYKTTTIVNEYPIIPPVPITPALPTPPPLLPKASMPPGGGVDSWSARRRKTFKQPKKYTPSATAMAFTIKGKKTKTGELTGVGMRPVPTNMPKPKKKLKF